MAEMKNDPSELYDADFMEKREQTSADTDALDKADTEKENEDAFEEKGGLFARFHRPSKKKEKKEKGRRRSTRGYDIFDLENLDPDEFSLGGRGDDDAPEQEEEAQQPAPHSAKEETETESPAGQQPDHDIDDINALLESIGIAPIGDEDPAQAAAPSAAAQPARADGKTRVVGDLSQKGSGKGAKAPSQKTKHFGAVSDTDADKAVRTEAASADGDVNSGHDDAQLLLDGYADEEAPDEISEQAVEAELKITRRNLIDNFRVLAKGGSDRAILERKSPSGGAKESPADSVAPTKGEGLFDAVDRIGKKKKSNGFMKRGAKGKTPPHKRAKSAGQPVNVAALAKKLKKRKNKRTLQTKILLVLTAAALLLSFFASGYEPGGVFDFMLANGARVFTVINLVLLAAGIAVSFDMFKSAVERIGELRCDSHVLMMIAVAFVVIHHIAMLAAGMYAETGIMLYSSCALFAISVQTFSESYSLSTMIKTLDFMRKSKNLEGIQPIDRDDTAALGHGISSDGRPKIFFGADVEIPADLEQLSQSDTDERIYRYSGMAVLVASFVFALVMSLVQKSASLFAGCLVASVCLCFPLVRSFVIAALSKRVNGTLTPHAAAIAGLDACVELGKSDAVVFDTRDIFEGSISKFRRVPGSRMATLDAVVYAASTLKKTKCVIANGFDDFLKEAQINLPEAEDVIYEERLGYSSWVAGRKVLVGNREMLVQHSVECPTEQEEKAYSKGKSVMYVVVEGIIAATFIVSYSVRGQVRRSVADFNNSGLILMLNTGDPCLSEALVAAKLSADIAAIKIISTKGSEIVSRYKNDSNLREDNGLVCSKNQRNLLPLVTAAHRLFSAERLVTLVSIAAVIFCFALQVFCVALKVSTGFTALTVIILQLAWGAAAYFSGQSRIH